MDALEPAEKLLVDASRRLGSLCRRQGVPEGQLLFLVESESLKIAESFMFATRTKALISSGAMITPVNVDKCRLYLPDMLDQAFMRLLILFSIRARSEATVDSGIAVNKLANEASASFNQRGRHVLASEVLRMAGRIVAGSGLLREADRLFIKAEDISTAASKWSLEKCGRVLKSISSGYGYAPLRLAGASVVLVLVVAGCSMVVLHFSFLKAISLAIGDYFTLGGAKEYFKLDRTERIVFALEAAGALLINGFFLTLLTKRLFRN